MDANLLANQINAQVKKSDKIFSLLKIDIFYHEQQQ